MSAVLIEKSWPQSTPDPVRIFGWRILTCLLAGLGSCALAVAGADDKSADYTTQTLRGRVVYLAESLEKQTGVPSVPEARERILALQTAAGELVPLLEDVRGRAFRRDERLRDMPLELVVRRYRQSPVVQIIRVIEVAKAGRFEIDYWCEICSIAMFEKKDCECCQADVELRRRKLD
jgi:hypothetical protein